MQTDEEVNAANALITLSLAGHSSGSTAPSASTVHSPSAQSDSELAELLCDIQRVISPWKGRTRSTASQDFASKFYSTFESDFEWLKNWTDRNDHHLKTKPNSEKDFSNALLKLFEGQALNMDNYSLANHDEVDRAASTLYNLKQARKAIVQPALQSTATASASIGRIYTPNGSIPEQQHFDQRREKYNAELPRNVAHKSAAMLPVPGTTAPTELVGNASKQKTVQNGHGQPVLLATRPGAPYAPQSSATISSKAQPRHFQVGSAMASTTLAASNQYHGRNALSHPVQSAHTAPYTTSGLCTDTVHSASQYRFHQRDIQPALQVSDNALYHEQLKRTNTFIQQPISTEHLASSSVHPYQQQYQASECTFTVSGQPQQHAQYGRAQHATGASSHQYASAFNRSSSSPLVLDEMTAIDMRNLYQRMASVEADNVQLRQQVELLQNALASVTSNPPPAATATSIQCPPPYIPTQADAPQMDILLSAIELRTATDLQNGQTSNVAVKMAGDNSDLQIPEPQHLQSQVMAFVNPNLEFAHAHQKSNQESMTVGITNSQSGHCRWLQQSSQINSLCTVENASSTSTPPEQLQADGIAVKVEHMSMATSQTSALVATSLPQAAQGALAVEHVEMFPSEQQALTALAGQHLNAASEFKPSVANGQFANSNPPSLVDFGKSGPDVDPEYDNVIEDVLSMDAESSQTKAAGSLANGENHKMPLGISNSQQSPSARIQQVKAYLKTTEPTSHSPFSSTDQASIESDFHSPPAIGQSTTICSTSFTSTASSTANQAAIGGTSTLPFEAHQPSTSYGTVGPKQPPTPVQKKSRVVLMPVQSPSNGAQIVPPASTTVENTPADPRQFLERSPMMQPSGSFLTANPPRQTLMQKAACSETLPHSVNVPQLRNLLYVQLGLQLRHRIASRASQPDELPATDGSSFSVPPTSQRDDSVPMIQKPRKRYSNANPLLDATTESSTLPAIAEPAGEMVNASKVLKSSGKNYSKITTTNERKPNLAKVNNDDASRRPSQATVDQCLQTEELDMSIFEKQNEAKANKVAIKSDSTSDDQAEPMEISSLHFGHTQSAKVENDGTVILPLSSNVTNVDASTIAPLYQLTAATQVEVPSTEPIQEQTQQSSATISLSQSVSTVQPLQKGLSTNMTDTASLAQIQSPFSPAPTSQPEPSTVANATTDKTAQPNSLVAIQVDSIEMPSAETTTNANRQNLDDSIQSITQNQTAKSDQQGSASERQLEEVSQRNEPVMSSNASFSVVDAAQPLGSNDTPNGENKRVRRKYTKRKLLLRSTAETPASNGPSRKPYCLRQKADKVDWSSVMKRGYTRRSQMATETLNQDVQCRSQQFSMQVNAAVQSKRGQALTASLSPLEKQPTADISLANESDIQLSSAEAADNRQVVAISASTSTQQSVEVIETAQQEVEPNIASTSAFPVTSMTQAEQSMANSDTATEFQMQQSILTDEAHCQNEFNQSSTSNATENTIDSEIARPLVTLDERPSTSTSVSVKPTITNAKKVNRRARQTKKRALSLTADKPSNSNCDNPNQRYPRRHRSKTIVESQQQSGDETEIEIHEQVVAEAESHLNCSNTIGVGPISDQASTSNSTASNDNQMEPSNEAETSSLLNELITKTVENVAKADVQVSQASTLNELSEEVDESTITSKSNSVDVQSNEQSSAIPPFKAILKTGPNKIKYGCKNARVKRLTKSTTALLAASAQMGESRTEQNVNSTLQVSTLPKRKPGRPRKHKTASKRKVSQIIAPVIVQNQSCLTFGENSPEMGQLVQETTATLPEDGNQTATTKLIEEQTSEASISNHAAIQSTSSQLSSTPQEKKRRRHRFSSDKLAVVEAQQKLPSLKDQLEMALKPSTSAAESARQIKRQTRHSESAISSDRDESADLPTKDNPINEQLSDFNSTASQQLSTHSQVENSQQDGIPPLDNPQQSHLTVDASPENHSNESKKETIVKKKRGRPSKKKKRFPLVVCQTGITAFSEQSTSSSVQHEPTKETIELMTGCDDSSQLPVERPPPKKKRKYMTAEKWAAAEALEKNLISSESLKEARETTSKADPSLKLRTRSVEQKLKINFLDSAAQMNQPSTSQFVDSNQTKVSDISISSQVQSDHNELQNTSAVFDDIQQPIKRKRGRPKKIKLEKMETL